jgi:hypothetical protein
MYLENEMDGPIDDITLDDAISILNEYDDKLRWVYESREIKRFLRDPIVTYQLSYRPKKGLDEFAPVFKRPTTDIDYLIKFIEYRTSLLKHLKIKLKEKEEKELRVTNHFNKINASYFELEHNFCFDFDKVKQVSYTDEELCEATYNIFEYLTDFPASATRVDRTHYMNTSDTVHFRDFSIKRITRLSCEQMFEVRLCGSLLAVVSLEIQEDCSCNHSATYFLLDYVEHYVYAYNYILEFQEKQRQRNLELKIEHIDNALKKYECED